MLAVYADSLPSVCWYIDACSGMMIACIDCM